MAANLIRERAVAFPDGLLKGIAHVVIAGKTLLAMEATASIPAEADGIADLDILCANAGGGHNADRLMSGHKGKCGCVPLVVAHGEVRVADAAVFNVNFNLIVLKRTGIEGESSKFTARLRRS
jgi:hypothetical protein